MSMTNQEKDEIAAEIGTQECEIEPENLVSAVDCINFLFKKMGVTQ